MVFGTATATFAENVKITDGTDGPVETVITDKFSLTIGTDKSNTSNVHTYEAYQIFAGDLVVDETSDAAISASQTATTPTSLRRLSNVVWGSNITASQALIVELKSLVDANSEVDFSGIPDYSATNDTSAAYVAEQLGKVTARDSKIAQDFADVISKYLTGTAKTSTAYADAAETTPATDSVDHYKIADLDAGYYIIKDKDNELNNDDDSYTRFLLEVIADVATNPKADWPTVIKKVKENDTTANPITGNTDTRLPDYEITQDFNDVGDYDIGEIIPFEMVGTIPSNYDKYDGYEYKFTDTMSTGLGYYADETHQLLVEYRNLAVNPTTGEAIGGYETDWHIINLKDNASTNNYIPSDGTNPDTIANGVQSFTIEFPAVYDAAAKTWTKTGLKKIAEIKPGAQIRVSFYGKLNENAVIGHDGNTNETNLTFSNNPNVGGEGNTGETPIDKVIVFTYEIDTTKVDGTMTAVKAEDAIAETLNNLDSTVNNYTDKATGKKYVKVNNVWYAIDGTKLKDAEFRLYKTVDGVKYYAVVDGDGKFVAWTKNSTNAKTEDASDTNYATTLKSDTNGLFKVIGLDEGTYTLEETKAPVGYNLAGPINVVIEATTVNNQEWTSYKPGEALTTFAYTVGDNDKITETYSPAVAEDTENNIEAQDEVKITGIASADVLDNKGTVLPSTGGIGTTIFYVLGAILVIGAGVLLITRRRMAQ